MSHWLLVVVLQMIGVAVIMSWLWTREYKSFAGTAALVIGILGALILYDGFRLAVREELRNRFGKVVPGLIEGRWTTSADAPYGTNSRRNDSSVRTDAVDAYQQFARFLATGSLDPWAIQYSYACKVGIGICYGQDFVRRELWSALHVGDSVNVRQSTDETITSRLDQNPQLGLALVKMALGGLVLAVAELVSGRLTFFQRPKYIQADATVTSVERVQYGDESRWKVRFAYFDLKGEAQDSVDEVNDPSWKAGDACFAIYRPQSPDLATLQQGHRRV